MRAERKDDRLFVGRRLELEAEPPAEPLAQREAPGPVHASSERRVQHELHSARFVEEALEDDALARRDGSERVRPRFDVLRELGRGCLVQPRLPHEPDRIAPLLPDPRDGG